MIRINNDYVIETDGLQYIRENERLKGEIKGLRFAIRCNGVSGNEVPE